MKKIFIPALLAALVSTAAMAATTEHHQTDTAATTAAATATDKLAIEKDSAAHTTAVVTTTDHVDAHPVDGKTAVVVKNAPAKKGASHRHHSHVDVKTANEITERLNAGTCTTPAVPVA